MKCTSHLFVEETFTSAYTEHTPSSPATFWLRNQQKQLPHVGATETVGRGHTRASPASASIAYPGRRMLTKHERKGHNGRIARPGRSTTYPLAGIRRGLPVIADSANRAALRDCSRCPNEIATERIKQHGGVRVSRNKQPPHPFHTPSSCQCAVPQYNQS